MTGFLVAALLSPLPPDREEIRVRMTWGHDSPPGTPFRVRIAPGGGGVSLGESRGFLLENGEGPAAQGGEGAAWETRAGGGDVDGIEFSLRWPREGRAFRKLHSLWSALLSASDEDTVRRLRGDPAHQVDPPLLLVQLDGEGMKGFAAAADQLARERAIWVPAYDLFLAAGDSPVSFEEHRRSLEPLRGRRILDRVREGPEEGYADFTARWSTWAIRGILIPPTSWGSRGTARFPSSGSTVSGAWPATWGTPTSFRCP